MPRFHVAFDTVLVLAFDMVLATSYFDAVFSTILALDFNTIYVAFNFNAVFAAFNDIYVTFNIQPCQPSRLFICLPTTQRHPPENGLLHPRFDRPL